MLSQQFFLNKAINYSLSYKYQLQINSIIRFNGEPKI